MKSVAAHIACGLAQLLLIVSSRSSLAEFLEEPSVKWTVNLPTANGGGGGSNEVLRGNAVRASRNGNVVLVTTRDGRLHGIRTSGGTPGDDDDDDDDDDIAVYEPDPMPSYCASGVALHEGTGDDGDAAASFAVYAVVDATGNAANSESTTSSRIIGVSFEGDGAAELWSVTVDGAVAGTPILSQDGKKVYVVHNLLEPNENRGNLEPLASGMVSVIEISASSEAQVASTMSSDEFDFGRIALGPPTYKFKSSGGGGEIVLAVAAATSPIGGPGGLYAIMPDSQEWNRISGYPMPTRLKPALGQGQETDSCYLAHGTILTAWDGNRDISGVIEDGDSDIFPSWEEVLQYTPISTPPVLSFDNGRLFVTSTRPQLICYETDRGRAQWTLDLEDVVVAEPLLVKASADGSNNNNGPGGGGDGVNEVLYVIEAATGIVRQINPSEGYENWEARCEQVLDNQNCAVSVEAEFSSSENGNVLYFAYTDGTVVALQVGSFETAAPTPAPTVPPPTPTPTAAKVVATPAPSAMQEVKTTPAPTEPIEEETAVAEDSTSTQDKEQQDEMQQQQPGKQAQDTTGQNNDEQETQQQQEESQNANSASKSEGAVGSENTDEMMNIAIILGAVVGGLAILVCIAVTMVCRQKRRDSKRKTEVEQREAETDHVWLQNKIAYEKECQDLEQQTLQELGAGETTPRIKNPAVPPPAIGSASTDRTLDSIAESPEDDGTALSERDSSTEAGFEVSLKEQVDPPLQEDKGPSGSPIINTVRNLSQTFAEASTPAVAEEERNIGGTKLEPVKHAQLVQGLNIARSTSQDSSVIKQQLSVDSHDDRTAGEMSGYIPLQYTNKGNTPPPLPQPMTPSSRTRSGDRKGASSPSFSDIWSVDESLYIDDETTSKASNAVRDDTSKGPIPSIPPVPRSALSSDHPDDESIPNIPARPHQLQTRPNAVAQQPSPPVYRPAAPPLPPAPDAKMNQNRASSMALKSSAPTKPSPPKANPRASPKASNGNRKMPLHSEDMSYGTSRGAAFMAGTTSKRTKAGLFTRREQEQLAAFSLADRSDSDTTSTSINPESIQDAPVTEPRAMYVPEEMIADEKKVDADARSNKVSSSKLSGSGSRSPRESVVHKKSANKQSKSQKRDTPKTKVSKQKQPPPKPASAWDSFLVELTKVEEQFFSPFASPPAPPPPPPRPKPDGSGRRSNSSRPIASPSQGPSRRRSQQESCSDSEESDDSGASSTSESDSINAGDPQPIRRFA